MTIEEKIDNEADLVQTTAVNGSTVVLPVLYVPQVKELIKEACAKQRQTCAKEYADKAYQFYPECFDINLNKAIINAPEPTWGDK